MKGICFKEPLFHATIDGRKTQTRRIMNPQPSMYRQTVAKLLEMFNLNPSALKDAMKPRYKLGEVVYLKEPYAYMSLLNYEPIPVYRYGKTADEIAAYDADDGCGGLVTGWNNKLFMPESAARYFIRITAVRADRLQDISDEDCKLEGCRHVGTDKWMNDFDGKIYQTGEESYAALIDKINGKGTWNSNPFVWLYDYELYKPE